MVPVDEVSSQAAGPRGDRPGPKLRWSVICWTVVLTLTGVVQVMRGQWFDTVFFFAAATLTAAGPWLPGREARNVPSGGTALGLLIALAAGLSLLPRHSSWMVGALLLVGLVALVFAWTSPSGDVQTRPRWTQGLRQLGLAWAAVVIAGCIWELAQFVLGYLKPDQPAYALSDLIDPLLDGWPGKAAFVAVWLAGGAFLLHRGIGRGDRS
ncbi:hypothetical protein [Leucobacter salsicius]|uniref:hypothetical protein n=1 Tax=Leucobacter salsicius TaxID=664638 RepID=UPI0003716555|nr:hypothetical protein [Leucobacter salsicius]